MANSAAAGFQRIPVPDGLPASMKAYVRRVNDALEEITTKMNGYLPYNSLSTAAQNTISQNANTAVSSALYRGAADPANPTDGQLVMNTTENVLKRWDATAGAYTIIADYGTMNTQLGAVQAVTVNSADFLGLLASAAYTENGLLLSGINAILQLLLGPAGIYFKDTGEVVAYITGQVMHITSIEVDSIKIGPVTFIKTENGYIRK